MPPLQAMLVFRVGNMKKKQSYDSILLYFCPNPTGVAGGAAAKKGTDGGAAGKKAAAAADATMKRPAAAMLAGNAPKCPGVNSAPMLFKKGKISYSTSKEGWRVWVDKTNVAAEKFVKGGPESWQKVLDKFK